jgi:hypothetical protein
MSLAGRIGRTFESSRPRPLGQPLLAAAHLGTTARQRAAEQAQSEEIELLAELIARANQESGMLEPAVIDRVLGCTTPDQAVA